MKKRAQPNALRPKDKKDSAPTPSDPWDRRREAAAELTRSWGSRVPDAQALEAARTFALDPKPEVRKEIALALVHLPDEAFVPMAALLSEDSNAFVQKAAQRALERRRKSSRQQAKSRRALGAVESALTNFEKIYGAQALKAALHIADTQYAVLVQQTHHNIPNILSPVKTAISLLKRKLEAGQTDKAYCLETLAEMATCLDYLERFLQDLNAYAKAKSAVAKRRERLSTMVQQAQAMAWAALQELGRPAKGVHCSIGIPEHLTVVVARHQVVTALSHLIRNACEALTTAKGRRIRTQPLVKISARELGRQGVELIVKDNGPGVHPDDIARLREFAPLEKSRKPHGTGFGIATAAAYIEAQGGALTLASRHGKGFAAVIQLPTTNEEGGT